MFSVSLALSPAVALEAPPVPIVTETLQQKAERIAVEMEFPFTIVKSTIDAETGGTWDCSKIGKAGELGCLQIIPEYHDVDPLDFEASVRYFITEYKKGHEYYWTSCSCISTAKALGVKIPPKTSASDIITNSSPKIGGLLVLKYGKIAHVAVIKEIHRELGEESYYLVREGNFKPCELSERKILMNDSKIKGFYFPPQEG